VKWIESTNITTEPHFILMQHYPNMVRQRERELGVKWSATKQDVAYQPDQLCIDYDTLAQRQAPSASTEDQPSSSSSSSDQHSAMLDNQPSALLDNQHSIMFDEDQPSTTSTTSLPTAHRDKRSKPSDDDDLSNDDLSNNDINQLIQPISLLETFQLDLQKAQQSDSKLSKIIE